MLFGCLLIHQIEPAQGDFAVVIFGVGFENQFYVFVLFDERFDGTGGFLAIGA